jgi:RNA polymerase sigma-70 factor (sigma-E family)
VVHAADGVGDLSLEEAYDRYAPSLRRLAFFLTGDREVADDLVQEAFVRVAPHLPELDPAAVAAYLRRAVVNVARTYLRRKGLERRLALVFLGDRNPTDAAPADAERAQDVWNCLLRLPMRQRAALVLRYYEDLSEAETARAMGCSRRAVNSLVSRGLKRLRGEMTQRVSRSGPDHAVRGG